MLPTSPLEIKDFSGGITDNILQGDPSRSAKLDNFVITNDKKLLVRDGFDFVNTNVLIPFMVYENVGAMFSGPGDDGIVLGKSSEAIMCLDRTNWVNITAKGGDVTYGLPTPQTLGGNGAYNQITNSEFKKQIYLTSDAVTLPSKIYQDENNSWWSKTVGLPKYKNKNTYTDSQLLSRCVALANALRTSMINHMEDYQFATYDTSDYFGTSTVKLHKNRDKYSLSYFQTESFSGSDPEIPSPIPAATPIASNEATLYNLIEALASAYTHHMRDSTVGAVNEAAGITYQAYSGSTELNKMPLYHIFCRTVDSPWKTVVGPACELNEVDKPDNLIDAANMLNDILQKWYFHQFGVNTHSFYNEYALMNKYVVPLGTIENLQTTIDKDKNPILLKNAYPIITPDFSDVYNYVNNLKSIFNNHISGDGTPGTTVNYHTQNDTDYPSTTYSVSSVIDIPDCADKNSMYLMIYWLRAMYNNHIMDVVNPVDNAWGIPGTFNYYKYLGIRFTTAAGSPNITAVTRISDGSAIQLVPGAWIWGGLSFSPLANSYSPNSGPSSDGSLCRVLSSGSGTATVDRNASLTSGPSSAMASGSSFHAYADYDASISNPGLDSVGTVFDESSELPTPASYAGTNMQSWLDLANEMFVCMGAHANDKNVHPSFENSVSQGWTNCITLCSNKFFMPDVSSASYAFYYSDQYTVEANGVDFLTRGNPVYTPVMDIAVSYPQNFLIMSKYPDLYPDVFAPAVRSNVISGLQKLENSGLSKYDVRNSTLNIYRTKDDGTVYYEIGTLFDMYASGLTSFTDSVNDTVSGNDEDSLDTREQLYTTGGVVGYDQPPKSKCMYIFGTTAFYGGVYDGEQFLPKRIIQSIQNVPDSAPATFYDDFDDDIVAISSAKNNLIILCKNSIFRENGGFDNLGKGSLYHEKITDIVGCVSANSVVKTEAGLFFAGTDGFYFTDGYQVIKISLELDITYSNLTRSETQKSAIKGIYDSLNRRILWSVCSSFNGKDTDQIYVFHLNFGVKPSGCFTRFLNGYKDLDADLNLFHPNSMMFKDGSIYFATSIGAFLMTFEDKKTDKFYSSRYASIMDTHIPYDYLSCAIDMGTAFKRKWLTRLHIVGDNHGNVMADPYVVRDKNFDYNGVKSMAPINYKDNDYWGDPRKVWGTADDHWGNYGKMDLWRRFPQTTLRADMVQVGIRPVDGVVYSNTGDYPEYCTCHVDNTTKVATITNPSGYTDIVWPRDCQGMYISFDTDDYENKYLIESAPGSTQITYSDPDNLSSVNTAANWQISGYKLQQKLHVSSLVVHYAYLGDENQSYPGAKTNAGPGNGGANP